MDRISRQKSFIICFDLKIICDRLDRFLDNDHSELNFEPTHLRKHHFGLIVQEFHGSFFCLYVSM